MADKTYKMTVTLSDGSTVDAGRFVSPQGPQGAQGIQGVQGEQGEQGKSVFYSTAPSGTSIGAPSLMTDTIVPLVGDIMIFSNGDIRAVTAVDFDLITCGQVLANIKGPKGDTGATGPKGDTGTQGPKGDTGATGIGVKSISITEV